MYFKSYKDQIRNIDGSPKLIMPFELKDENSHNWPVLDARADSGKYVMGLFQGGAAANGVHVAAVSTWTSPAELLKAVSEASGTQVTFQMVPQKEIAASLPSNIASELTETMLLVGNYQYYGPGTEKQQEQNDKWLLKGSKVTDFKKIVENAGPWSL